MRVFPIVSRVFVVNWVMAVKITDLFTMDMKLFYATVFSREFMLTIFGVDIFSFFQTFLSTRVTSVGMKMDVSDLNTALISRITLFLRPLISRVFLVVLAWLLSMANNRFFLYLKFVRVVMLRMFKRGGYFMFQLCFVVLLSCLL